MKLTGISIILTTLCIVSLAQVPLKFTKNINSNNENLQNISNGNNQESKSNDVELDSVVIEANTLAPKIVNDYKNGDNLNLLTDYREPDADSCECVPYYLCNANGTINEHGEGVIDIRIKQPSCESYLEICCKSPKNPSVVTTTNTTRYPNSDNTSGCGKRNIDGVGGRILGDINNESQFGEFPWMVAILRNESINNNTTLKVFQCGGSLIHPRVVMTAAHCVANRDPKTLLLRAGEWDTQTNEEMFPHVEVGVQQIIVHEQFYSAALHNDIALMITDKPVQLTDHIDTVCLPAQSYAKNDDTCTATGWGKDTFGKNGTYQVILKKIELPIVPRDRCLDRLRTTRLTKYFKLHDSFLCAGGIAGRDTCKGDGGGPLVCPITTTQSLGHTETRFQQIGIVAWGIGCGTDIPAVYVDVARFRNWIDHQMAKLNFDKKYYSIQ